MKPRPNCGPTLTVVETAGRDSMLTHGWDYRTKTKHLCMVGAQNPNLLTILGGVLLVAVLVLMAAVPNLATLLPPAINQLRSRPQPGSGFVGGGSRVSADAKGGGRAGHGDNRIEADTELAERVWRMHAGERDPIVSHSLPPSGNPVSIARWLLAPRRGALKIGRRFERRHPGIRKDPRPGGPG